jgi:hypothetical protein
LPRDDEPARFGALTKLAHRLVRLIMMDVPKPELLDRGIENRRLRAMPFQKRISDLLSCTQLATPLSANGC